MMLECHKYGAMLCRSRYLCCFIQQALKTQPSYMDLTLVQAAAPVVAAAPTSAAVQEVAKKASPPADDDDDDDDDEDVDLFGEMTPVSSTTVLTGKVLFLECTALKRSLSDQNCCRARS